MFLTEKQTICQPQIFDLKFPTERACILTSNSGGGGACEMQAVAVLRNSL